MSFLNSALHGPDQTRTTDRLGLRTHPLALSDRRLVHSISTCTDFVRGSGLVGSQTKSVGSCSGIQKRHDQTRPTTKSGRARAKFHYTDQTRPTRPDPTRQSPRSCRRPARSQRTLSETQVVDQTKFADLSEIRTDPTGARQSLTGPV